MRTIKSPGALSAHGASEIDGLGPHVVSQTNRQLQLLQAPIRATLIGCSAEGISARGYDPVLDLCRELVAAGRSPTSPLKGWRGETLCLRVGSIGEAAQLTVAAHHAFDAVRSARKGMAQARLSPKMQTSGK